MIPVLVSGPVLSQDTSTSIEVFKKLMDGSMPGAPNLSYELVDVRDVASLHLIAMTKSEAAGQRLIATNDDPESLILDLGRIIREKRPEKAKKVPSFQVPNIVVRALALFDKPIRLILPDLGKTLRTTNQKARGLGWEPRGTEESALDTIDSLVKYGLA